MLVVSNTSPLCNLAIIDHLDLLPLRYERVLIPERVAQELAALSHEGGQRRIQEAIQAGWLMVRTLPSPNMSTAYEIRVDPGEAEAIALAESLHADKLIIDDRLGRELARERGVPVAGLLGELLHAKLQGHLAKIAPIMDRLRTEARFFIREDLRDLILRQAGE